MTPREHWRMSSPLECQKKRGMQMMLEVCFQAPSSASQHGRLLQGNQMSPCKTCSLQKAQEPAHQNRSGSQGLPRWGPKATHSQPWFARVICGPSARASLGTRHSLADFRAPTSEFWLGLGPATLVFTSPPGMLSAYEPLVESSL